MTLWSLVDFLPLWGWVVLVVGSVLGWWGIRRLLATPDVTSGREQYESNGMGDSVRSRLSESDVPIERIDKRDPNGTVVPSLHEDVSCMVIGQTGTGKSTFVKARLERWDFDGAVVAHALSEASKINEFVKFFEGRGQQVVKISSRDSTHRWDPLVDYGQSLRGLETLSRGLFKTREAVETGWSDPAQSLCTCALAVTTVEEQDFAAFPDVASRSPMRLVKACEDLSIQGTKTITRPLRDLGEEERTAVHSTMLNQVRPLLLSDIVDEDLSRVSLRKYLAEPEGRILVCDNIRRDRHASPFWRLFLQSAIDISYGIDGRQQFLLDEFDKLPKIENLPGLASAGRSAGVVGMLVAQDVHQIESRYDSMARSLWTNCPNRAAFRIGDMETAELVLSGIGRHEMERQSLSEGTDPTDQRISKTIAVQQPLVSGELMGLDVGEALIQSRDGWWLGKLGEPNTSTTEDPNQPALEAGEETVTSAADRFRRFSQRLNNGEP